MSEESGIVVHASCTEMAISADEISATVPRSKNALKRERRIQRWQEKKMELKRQKKEAKKANKVTPDVTEDMTKDEKYDAAEAAEIMEARRQRKLRTQQDFISKCDQNYAVVIDCNFENNHSDRALGIIVIFTVFYLDFSCLLCMIHV